MARSGVFTVTDNWSALTDGAVAALTVQNRGSQEMEISPTQVETRGPPEGLVLPPRTALVNRRMSDLFPGVVAAGATSVLYGRTTGGRGFVFVSHV